MKILTVVYPESTSNIHVYSKPIKNSMLEEVNEALVELGETANLEETEDISQSLLHSEKYWLNETYCFEVINI